MILPGLLLILVLIRRKRTRLKIGPDLSLNPGRRQAMRAPFQTEYGIPVNGIP